MTFGAFLQSAREGAGVSRAQLAERMGCSRVQVHRIESGANLTTATIVRYCDALGLEVSLTVKPKSDAGDPKVLDRPRVRRRLKR